VRLLQCVAVCCSVLQERCSADSLRVCLPVAKHCNITKAAENSQNQLEEWFSNNQLSHTLTSENFQWRSALTLPRQLCADACSSRCVCAFACVRVRVCMYEQVHILI